MFIAVFWFQIDMFMQLKIAAIVAIRYVFWAAACRYAKNAFLPLQLSPRLFSCCLLLYLNIADLLQGPGKCFWGPGKSWKSSGIFCIQESGNPELETVLMCWWNFKEMRSQKSPELFQFGHTFVHRQPDAPQHRWRSTATEACTGADPPTGHHS